MDPPNKKSSRPRRFSLQALGLVPFHPLANPIRQAEAEAGFLGTAGGGFPGPLEGLGIVAFHAGAGLIAMDQHVLRLCFPAARRGWRVRGTGIPLLYH